MHYSHPTRRHFAFLAAALVAAACGNSTSPTAGTSTDRALIDGMVPHHQMAITSADMAIANAVHPELKQFAQTMKSDQSQEVTLMQGWKRQWFGTDSTPHPMLSADIPPGPNFDLLWITNMIRHHQSAIDMSTLALQGNAHAQTDSLANHIITEQQQDQQQLQSWAQQWYGVTPSISLNPPTQP